MKHFPSFLIILFFIASCTGGLKRTDQKNEAMTIDSVNQYGYNRDFLKKFVSVVELRNNGSAVTLIPAWQGRVMTSTANGDEGYSFGWINRDLILSQKIQPHINAFGGEERLWP